MLNVEEGLYSGKALFLGIRFSKMTPITKKTPKKTIANLGLPVI
jgi:hypothetical protein